MISVKHLGTAINGAVDSPVQGGVKLYRHTFLNERYASRHPEEEEQIDNLRAAVLDYARTIQRALDLHGRVCRDAAFHEALRSRESPSVYSETDKRLTHLQTSCGHSQMRLPVYPYHPRRSNRQDRYRHLTSILFPTGSSLRRRPASRAYRPDRPSPSPLRMRCRPYDLTLLPRPLPNRHQSRPALCPR